MRDINQSMATANYRKRVERLLREVKITKTDDSEFTDRDESAIFQSAENGGRLFLAANYEIVNKKKIIFAYNLAEHGFGAQNTTVGSKARFATEGYIIVPPTLAFPSQEWQKQVYRDLDVELPQVHSLRKAVLESDKPKASPLLSQQPKASQDSNQWHPNSFQRNMNAASREWGAQSQQAYEFQTPLHPRGGGKGDGKGGSWTHTWSGKGKGGYGSSHSDGGYGYGQSWQGSSGNTGSQQSWQGSQHSSNDNFSNEAYGQSRGRSRDRGSNRGGDKRNSGHRSRSRDGGKPLIPPSGGHTALGAIIAKMILTSMCV
jgi:hypothetical protein